MGNNKIPKYIITGGLKNGYTKTRIRIMVTGRADEVLTVDKADIVVCDFPEKNSKKYQEGIKRGKEILSSSELFERVFNSKKCILNQLRVMTNG